MRICTSNSSLDPRRDGEVEPLRPLTGLPDSQELDVVAEVIDGSGPLGFLTAVLQRWASPEHVF